MTQPTFWDEPEDDSPLTLRERFERFHQRHPEVYDGLIEVCRAWCQRGSGHWSIDAAFHVLRFTRRMAGLPDDDEIYKLNNNYTAFYARLLMEQEPEFDGLFELRRQRAEVAG